MSKPQNPEVPAEIPARPRDRRDENPAKSQREWEAFFAAIEEAEDREEVA
jgi:hypothetical protein